MSDFIEGPWQIRVDYSNKTIIVHSILILSQRRNAVSFADQCLQKLYHDSASKRNQEDPLTGSTDMRH